MCGNHFSSQAHFSAQNRTGSFPCKVVIRRNIQEEKLPTVHYTKKSFFKHCSEPCNRLCFVSFACMQIHCRSTIIINISPALPGNFVHDLVAISMSFATCNFLPLSLSNPNRTQSHTNTHIARCQNNNPASKSSRAERESVLMSS